MSDLVHKLSLLLEYSGFPVGTVRKWKMGTYEKQKDGSWDRIGDPRKGTKAKISGKEKVRRGPKVLKPCKKGQLRNPATGSCMRAQEVKRNMDELAKYADSAKDWKDWYDRYEDTLKTVLKEDVGLFKQLLSATSQSTGVAGNVTLALKAYRQLLDGEEFTGYMGPVIKNLNKIRDDVGIKGAKIAEFGKAVAGSKSGIAVDRHVVALMFGKLKSPSGKDRTPTDVETAVAKSVVRKLAKRLGWAPREVQAALWAANQIRTGTKAEDIHSYDTYVMQRKDEIESLMKAHGRGISEAKTGGVKPSMLRMLSTKRKSLVRILKMLKLLGKKV